MRRREFMVVLAGVMAAASPLAAREKLVTIGFLGASSALSQKERVAAFVHRLRELDWVEGRNVSIEYRWADGRAERYGEFAAEFVRLGADIIVTGGAAAVIAAKQVTSTIPIVFYVAADPVGSGLVASLARPGGNITGMSYVGPDLATKRLQLLRELLPRLVKLAVMANPDTSGAALELREVHKAAPALGLDLIPLLARRAEDIGPAFASLKDAEAIYVCADPMVNSNRPQIVRLALAARLPTMFGERENVDEGGLLSYGPNIRDLCRRAAELVDKILRHVAAPADIPVEQPTRFELIVNLRTAKALGINVPPELLARADEVIE
jgi:putative tryptophan/tyrosine transport system substrate-binding protein